MKIIKRFAIVAAMSALAVQAYGQTVDGYLMSRNGIGVSDMLMMSQYNTAFGTARSSAMGGAFTSLGANTASMGINPAGLGMYLSSEFSVTPSVMISKYNNSSIGAPGGGDNSHSRFGFNNIGIALNTYQGSGALTSFTFGFAYNKLADFNYRSSFSTAPDQYSIADVFTNQLWGVNPEALRDSANPWQNTDLHPSEWGAILAWKTGMIDSERKIYNPGTPEEYDADVYYIDGNKLSGDASIGHITQVESRGSIGEYSIAGGWNFRNLVYLGFSIGIQDIYMRQSYLYSEDYGNNNVSDPMMYMDYEQRIKIYGTGVNFKLGAIVQPITGLRIGLAVHTPTFISLEKSYEASMYTKFSGGSGDYGSSWTIPAVSDYKFITPTRLLTGVSYTFGEYGIISADYECTWYNGIRAQLKDSERYYTNDGIRGDVQQEIADQVKADYKAGHTVRLGGEFRPIPEVAVRAGYAYAASMLQNDNGVFDSPVAYTNQNISGGVGLRLGRYASLDVAYVYMKTKFTEYDMFYYNGPNNDGQPVEILADHGIKTTSNRHNVMATLGFRF